MVVFDLFTLRATFTKDCVDIDFIEEVLRKGHSDLTSTLLAKIVTLPQERVESMITSCGFQSQYPSWGKACFRFNEIMRALSHFKALPFKQKLVYINTIYRRINHWS